MNFKNPNGVRPYRTLIRILFFKINAYCSISFFLLGYVLMTIVDLNIYLDFDHNNNHVLWHLTVDIIFIDCFYFNLHVTVICIMIS